MRIWHLDTSTGRLNHGRAFSRLLQWADAQRHRHDPVSWPWRERVPSAVQAEEPQDTAKKACSIPARERDGFLKLVRGRRQPVGGAWTITSAPWREPIPTPPHWSLSVGSLLAASLLLALGLFSIPKLAWGLFLVGALTGPQSFNRGSAPGDHTGETLYTAGGKLNANLQRTLTCAATYNTATFPGSTAVAKINAAIAAAAADGASAAWTPRADANGLAMLPYDASQVAFNPAVQMVCEAGFPSSLGYDVIAYGAWGNNNHDDQPAIQAILDTLMSHLGGRILFPYPSPLESNPNNTGQYCYGLPLWIKANRTEFLGIGRGKNGGTPTLRPLFSGSGIFNAAANAALPITTSLYGTASKAIDFTVSAGQVQLFDLRDVPASELNGLAQFCYETDFMIRGPYTSSNCALGSSMGVHLQSDSQIPAYRLLVIGATQKLYAEFATSGGHVVLNGTTNVSTDTKHHAGIAYDGTTVRLLLDGTVEASTPLTGTVVQNVANDVMVGCEILGSPQQSLNVMPDQVVQGWARLSNTALYTGSYTPPGKPLTTGATTLILLNFETNYGPATKALLANNGVAWIVMRNSGIPWGTSGHSFENLCFRDYGAAPWGRSNTVAIHLLNPCFEPHFSRVQFNDTRIGIKHLEGGYMGRYAELEFSLNGAGRYGVALGGLAGASQFDTVIFNIGSGRIGMFVGSNVVINNLFIQTTSNGFEPEVFGLLIHPIITTASVVVTNFGIATETGTASSFRGALALSGNLDANIQGGELESGTGGSTTPCVVLDRAIGATFTATDFRKNGAQTEYITDQGGSVLTPLALINPDRSVALPFTLTGEAEILLPPTIINFSATPIFDASHASLFRLTLTGNVLSSSFVNASPGQRIAFEITQDAIGSRTFAPPPNLSGFMTISGAPFSRSIQMFEVAR